MSPPTSTGTGTGTGISNGTVTVTVTGTGTGGDAPELIPVLVQEEEARKINIVIDGPHKEILPDVAIENFGQPNHVRVDPDLDIVTLKRILKPVLRIPHSDEFMLLGGDSDPWRLDDHLTLRQCGVKDGDCLLACRDSRLNIKVLNNQFFTCFPVELSSCFDNVAQVKNQLALSSGRWAENQIITTLHSERPLQDSATMASLGIFCPYSCEMILDPLALRVEFIQ